MKRRVRLLVALAMSVSIGAIDAQTPGRVSPIQHWCSPGWPRPFDDPQDNCNWLAEGWRNPLTFIPDGGAPAWFPKGYCRDLINIPATYPYPYQQYIQKPKFCPANYNVLNFIAGRGCGLPGYSDGFEGTDGMYCQRYGFDTNKNKGQCTAGSPMPSVGNPINTGIYNKFQSETDFEFGSGIHERVIGRVYNSAKVSEYGAVYGVPQPVLFGAHWASTFDRRVVAYLYGTYGTTYVVRPDGKAYFFNLVGSQWLPDPDVSDKLTRLVDGTGTPTGWTYVDAATQEVETYNVSGQLTQLQTRAGYALDLIYTGRRLSTVRDAFGRELTFAYGTNGLVSSISSPVTGTHLFRYDALYNLTEVEYPDASIRHYHYENTSFKNSLTGISDELGKV